MDNTALRKMISTAGADVNTTYILQKLEEKNGSLLQDLESAHLKSQRAEKLNAVTERKLYNSQNMLYDTNEKLVVALARADELAMELAAKSAPSTPRKAKSDNELIQAKKLADSQIAIISQLEAEILKCLSKIQVLDETNKRNSALMASQEKKIDQTMIDQSHLDELSGENDFLRQVVSDYREELKHLKGTIPLSTSVSNRDAANFTDSLTVIREQSLASLIVRDDSRPRLSSLVDMLLEIIKYTVQLGQSYLKRAISLPFTVLAVMWGWLAYNKDK